MLPTKVGGTRFELGRRVTAGLSSPPLTLENTYALTANEEPKLNETYHNRDGVLGSSITFGPVGSPRRAT